MDHADFDKALTIAQTKVKGLVAASPDQFPAYTANGQWVLDADPWAPNWCGGFLTGMLWIFARRCPDPWWRTTAQRYCNLLANRSLDTSTHDLGFLLEPSWGSWYRTEPTRRAIEVLIRGGRTLAQRYQSTGRYLSSWLDDGSTLIDIMMNVGLIFDAAELSGDTHLSEVAHAHCITTRKYLTRGDGSTVHEGLFEPSSGEFLKAKAVQGWRSDSTWARGQAWAIYGFDSAFEHTGDERFLDTATRAADFFIQHTDESGVPPNDFEGPRAYAGHEAREASAAAIAAAGMLRLARHTDGCRMTSEKYQAYAIQILRTLCTPAYIGSSNDGWQGVLRHAIYHRQEHLGLDESTMFGDYYFVEALDAASRL